MIIFLLLTQPSLGQDSPSKDEPISEEAGQQPQTKAPPSKDEVDAAFWKVHVGKPETYRTICEKPSDHDQADLCQQWRAAEASEQSAKWALIQLVASAIGIIGVVVSLFLSVRATCAAVRAANSAEQSIKVARQTAKQQLRAYLAARPRGIGTTTTGEVIGHVRLANVGHSPASGVRWSLRLTPHPDPDWHPPEIPDAEVIRTAGVVPVGAKMDRGSEGILRSAEGFLYVWGRATYLDGFKIRRFINFCHRYNTKAAIEDGSTYRIDASHGRQHDHGNDAD